jgi:hypothetical protein
MTSSSWARQTGQFGLVAYHVTRQPLQPECPHGSTTGGSIGSMHTGQSSALSAMSGPQGTEFAGRGQGRAALHLLGTRNKVPPPSLALPAAGTAAFTLYMYCTTD